MAFDRSFVRGPLSSFSLSRLRRVCRTICAKEKREIDERGTPSSSSDGETSGGQRDGEEAQREEQKRRAGERREEERARKREAGVSPRYESNGAQLRL